MGYHRHNPGLKGRYLPKIKDEMKQSIIIIIISIIIIITIMLYVARFGV